MWLVMSQRSCSVEKPAAFVTPSMWSAEHDRADGARSVRLSARTRPWCGGTWLTIISSGGGAVLAMVAMVEAIAQGRDNADGWTDLGNAFRFRDSREGARAIYDRATAESAA